MASLNEPGTSHGSIEEQIFEGYVTGDLGKYGIKSPWANDGVGVSFGIQNRWDHLVFAPDQAELSGDLAGFAGASVAVNNAIGVQEEYFEIRIPIAQKQPFAEDLDHRGRLPLLRLFHQRRRQHLQGRRRVVADPGLPPPRLVRPRDPGRQHPRSVHRRSW